MTLTFTVLVLVPAQIYVANRGGVLLSFTSFLAIAAATALLAGGLLGALLHSLPAAVRTRVVVLITSVTVLVWIHAYVLVWPYRVFDGEAIAWTEYRTRAVVDAALWLGVLTPAVWLAPRLTRFVAPVCAGLVAMQTVSLAVGAWKSRGDELDLAKQYYIDGRDALTFSSHRNVIVMLLDEYQTDVFASAVLADARHRAALAGFTYFPNTVAGANFTELALPALLTGRIYDNREPRHDFLRSAYLGSSLPAVLRRSGWSVDLYPWRGMANEALYYHESLASNFVRRPQPRTDQVADAARLFDLGLFRSAPQFAKRAIHHHGAWWLSRAARALAGTSARQKTAGELREHPTGLTLDNIFIQVALGLRRDETRFALQPGVDRFKFYHLAGLHVPVKLTRNLEWGNFAYTRSNYSDQALGYARIIDAFLAELRRIGAYDNSLIVLVGDHGSGRTAEMYIQPGDSPRVATLNRTAVLHDFQRDKARGLPLLLIKPFGATGELRTADTPASLVDLPATILHGAGIPFQPVPALVDHDDFTGRPLFVPQADARRPRYYGATDWSGEKSDYVNPITLYRVEGNAWSDDAWSYAGSRVQP